VKKDKQHYCCSFCKALFNKWSGQCVQCSTWGSISEQKEATSTKGEALPISTFFGKDLQNPDKTIYTSIKEMNHVLGGALVCGATILLGGDPGIGKSTLMLQLVANLAKDGTTCLYVSGEESINQIQLRASRLKEKPINDYAKIVATGDLEAIIATIESIPKLDVVVIDSIQTLHCRETSSAPGTMAQIRTSAQKLISYAKRKNISLFLVGHITKDGQIAGPKVLEHMVDTVLQFEGDHNYHYRILRALKNRFGPVNEVGVFEMSQNGLEEVTNPAQIFLTNNSESRSGSSVFVGIEGSRAMLAEIQALVAPSPMSPAKRNVIGWDHNRLSMILAVLAVRCGLNLYAHDVYLNIVGGLKISEPAADLAVAAAVISASTNKASPPGSVFFGEISLSGDVKKSIQQSKRINEAKKVGFKTLICNPSQEQKDTELNLISLSNVQQLREIFR
jgi:DNA repair protein RadA/Sms